MSAAGLLQLLQPTGVVPAILHRGDLDGLPIEIPGIAVDQVQVMSPDGITLLTYERSDWFFDNRRIYQFAGAVVLEQPQAVGA